MHIMWSLHGLGELLTRDGATLISCSSGKAGSPGYDERGDDSEGRAASDWRSENKSSAEFVSLE
jgi:hypothetical protein